MKKMNMLMLNLALCTHAMTSGDASGMSGGAPASAPAPQAPQAPAFDLKHLEGAALGWGIGVIQAAETIGGHDKLGLAAQGFGKALCDNINALEARSAVLSRFLNTPGMDAIEQGVVQNALDKGGPILSAMLRAAVQGIFTRVLLGHIF